MDWIDRKLHAPHRLRSIHPRWTEYEHPSLSLVINYGRLRQCERIAAYIRYLLYLVTLVVVDYDDGVALLL